MILSEFQVLRGRYNNRSNTGEAEPYTDAFITMRENNHTRRE